MKFRFVIPVMVMFGMGCQNTNDILPQNPIDSGVLDNVINDEVNGTPILVYGNASNNFYSAFKRTDDEGNIHNFSRSGLQFPDVLEDENGELWDAFGGNLSGDKGKKLQSVNYLIGYWFAIPPFHRQIRLVNGDEIVNNSLGVNHGTDGWLINKNFIFAGSVKEGIKSIDNAKFIEITSKQFIENSFYKSLDKDELLSVVQLGNEIKVFPHRIMEYHEIVNDYIGDLPIAFSFCPLTGTSRAWIRELDGKVFTFGVSGLLYNNNLILYDRTTNSHWSQILNLAVEGPFAGRKINELNVWQIRYEDILNIPGKVQALSTDTGILYDYQYPVYENYASSERVSFPLEFSDNRFLNKERVISVTIGDNTNVYRFEDFNQ